MTRPILVYDIPSKDPKGLPWSPNTWKTRLSLAYKGLPYKSEWVEFPDIERVSKRFGIPHNHLSATGSPIYTVPFIYDPNTKKHIADSIDIAKYLDETYPDTPKVVPEGTEALQRAFIQIACHTLVGDPLYHLAMLGTLKVLNPPSATFWRKSREAKFGIKLEDMATEEKWNAVVDGLGKLKDVLEAGGSQSGVFFMGENITLADMQIAGHLLWVKAVDQELWERISDLHGGKWKNFVDRFSIYVSTSV